MQLRRLSLPPLTRVLLAVCFVLSAVHQVSRFLLRRSSSNAATTGASYAVPVAALALVPQQSVFYPWVYLTATYAEQNIITFLVSALVITLAGRYLEQAWGTREFARFVLLNGLITNLLATVVYVLWFAVTRDPIRA